MQPGRGPRSALRAFACCLTACSLPLAASAAGGGGRPPARDATGKPRINVAKVIETVSHRVRPEGSKLVAEDPGYRVQFDDRGFAVTLRQPRQRGRARGSRPHREEPPRRHRPHDLSRFARAPGLRLGISRLRRGQQALAIRPGPWSNRQNEAEREIRPGVLEHVTAKRGKLEWKLILERGPRGDAAPLEIEARLDKRPGGKTARMRLGAVTLRDHDGRTVHRGRPAVRGGRVTITVPKRVAAKGRYPLTLEMTVSPEHPVSDMTYAMAQWDQYHSSITAGGDQYLVVWHAGRDAWKYSMIYGARVAPDVTGLDPAGIQIASTYAELPDVAWSGSHYLVTWQDGSSSSDIHGARVDPDGQVLDPGGIAISAAAQGQWRSAVGWNGSNFFVAWVDYRIDGSQP